MGRNHFGQCHKIAIGLYTTDHITCWLLAQEYRGNLIRGEALRTQYQALSISFKNVHNDWSYDCTPNTADVFEEGITLPGVPVVSLSATMPCRQQLCTLLGSSVSKLSSPCKCTSPLNRPTLDYSILYSRGYSLFVHSNFSVCLQMLNSVSIGLRCAGSSMLPLTSAMFYIGQRYKLLQFLL
jgi:hypothetical protein